MLYFELRVVKTYDVIAGLWVKEPNVVFGTIVYRKVVTYMTNKNTEIVVAQQEIDLKFEAKKQLRIAAVDSLNCAKQPAKDFANSVVDYFFNRFIDWVDSKLSA